MTRGTRGPVAFAALALGVAAVCARLGVWQLDRLDERRGRNAVIAARRAGAPVVLASPLPSGDSVWQRRVRAAGVFDYERERLWPGRSFDGAPGVALLTPLRLPDGSAVLVDRGWVPSADARGVDRAATREADSAAVAGLALRAPRARGDADPALLADSFPYPLAGFVVQWVPGRTAYGAARLPVRRWPVPRLEDGPHLSYAIQWFAFAAIAVGGAVAVLRQRGRASFAARANVLD